MKIALGIEYPLLLSKNKTISGLIFYYLYTHGATLFNINPIRKRSTSPAITFSILFFASSAADFSAPEIEYWIPETTNIRTPTSAVMKVAYLMSPLKISITLPKPGCMVHSYFLSSGLSLFPKLSLQSIPGIFSATVTFVAHPADELVVVVATGSAASVICKVDRINSKQTKIPPMIRKVFFFIKWGKYYNLKSAKSFKNA